MTSSKSTSRIREGFLLWYLAFFVAKGLNFVLPSVSIFHYLLVLCNMVYVPGMMYVAGIDIGRILREDEKPEKILRKRAIIFFGLYFCIGLVTEVLLKHRALFATVKDLMALLRMPSFGNIFLTLSLLYLLSSWLGDIMERKLTGWVCAVVAALGLGTVLIPDGLVGYSQIGLLIGADIAGAIPLAPCLPAFLWGWDEQRNQRKPVVYVAFFFGYLALGCLCVLTGHRNAGFVLAGTAAAFAGQRILDLLLPVYEAVEKIMVRAAERIVGLAQNIMEKTKQDKKWKLLVYYAGYTILFVCVTIAIFSPYIEGDRTLIWSVDGLGQYVPKIYRFISYMPQALRDILSGREFAQYDFGSGLGSTVAFSFDPVYWLYLLVKPHQIETVYSLMAILRYYLAGAAMSALILYLGQSFTAAYCGSFFYAYCGYAVYAGSKHAQFITPLFLLPLLVIAMELIIRKKSWYLMTAMVALSLLCSYYFLYMNTIALGIYFVLRILCDKKYRSFPMFFGRGLIITGSYFLGAAMGIIALVVQFGSFMGSSRTGGGSFADFLSITPMFYRKEWISDFFISFISDSFTPGLWLKLGFAPIALLCLVLLFTRKNRAELRSMFVLFTIFCMLPVMGYVFSGFSNVNNRWCYIYAAIIAVITACNIDYIKKLSQNELSLMLGITAVYTIILYFSTKFKTDKVFGVYGLLVLTMLFVVLISRSGLELFTKYSCVALLGITLFAVVMNANLFVTNESESGGHLATYVLKGTSKPRMESTALKYLDQVEGSDDGTFYRSTNQVTIGNHRSSSLVMGYRDLSTFTSTLNGNITDYNRAMGNCGWNIVSIYDYNNRTIMNELASVRYLAVSSGRKAAIPYGYREVFAKKRKKETISIYENAFALPLGYSYDSFMIEKEAENLNAIQKQGATMRTAIVSEKLPELAKTEKSQVTADIKKGKILDVKMNGVTASDGQLIVIAGSSIRFRFRTESNAETYLSFKGDLVAPKDAAEHFLKMNVATKDTRYLYKFRIDSYSTEQGEYLFNLGYHEKPINECTLYFDKDAILSCDTFEVYSQSMAAYDSLVAARKENVLEDIKVDKNTVTGKAAMDQEKLLVISLPYQKGWTAYVDGKKAKILNANYQYMGLLLPKGEHTIRLHYQLPWIQQAFLITAAGFAIYILCLAYHLFRKKQKKTH